MESTDIQALLQQLESQTHKPVTRIETHISWVLLTGKVAFKIKKPVNFGFLDFSTLEKRRFYCHEEVRLNQRYSKDIYIAALPIVYDNGSIRLSDPEEVAAREDIRIIDYTVKMHQFDRNQELDKAHDRHALDRDTCEALAATLAATHQHAQQADTEKPYGNPDIVQSPILDNFNYLNQRLQDPHTQVKVDQLRAWTDEQFPQLEPIMIDRKAQGFVKECHGDLHLGNITRIKGALTFFDCIEFNPEFRWIDTQSELAFLLMDLEARTGFTQAHWVLNRYLADSGDYTGLGLLNYYKVYRALVRAKIAELTWYNADAKPDGTTPKPQQQAPLKDFTRYIDLAMHYIQPQKPLMILMHGISGSGKSTVATRLAEQIGAIHLRSDVERKRRFGLKATDASAEQQDLVYSPSTSDAVFAHLLSLTQSILRSGFSVIVDATFILRQRRAPFLVWANAEGFFSVVLGCHLPLSTAESWIQQRAREGLDPSEATIDIARQQLKQLETVTTMECDALYSVDPSVEQTVTQALASIKKHNLDDRALPESNTAWQGRKNLNEETSK